MTKNILYGENGYGWIVTPEESILGFDYFYREISESDAIKLRLKCDSIRMNSRPIDQIEELVSEKYIEGRVHVGQIDKLLSEE